MPVRRPESCPKAAVSMSEMARMCELSRSRFYELIAAGIMPSPVYDVRTRRPIFTSEIQAECLQVRASNIGQNGEYILFYAKRQTNPAAPQTPRRSSQPAPVPPTSELPPDLLDTLRSLGLSDVTEGEVQAAIATSFPNGTVGQAEGDIIRTVFRRLRGPNAA